MAWTSPAWLIGLLPWAAGVAYLWVRAGRPVAVPHLWLWREAAGATTRRPTKRRLPPAGVMLGLLAAAVGVVAAAGPAWRAGDSGTAVVVLDRGAGWARPPAYRGMIERAAAILGSTRARLVCVPPIQGASDEATADWAARAARVPPVAIDTAAAVNATVSAVVRATRRGRILVLTDHAVGGHDGRVLTVGPERPAGGVGIVSVAARDRPRPQVMVRLVNRSTRSTAVVRVTSGTASTERAVPLPATGRTTAVYVDVRRLGPTVGVWVDDATIDGRAWLASRDEGAEVVATPDAPAAVARMTAVYNRSLAAGPRRTIVVSDRLPSPDQPGVCVTDAGPAGGMEAVRVSNHPVTDGVTDWPGGGGAMPAGFRPIVTRGGRPVVAVRDGPPWQVWAAVDVGRMSMSADWVVFLANAFRWVGGAGDRYAAVAPQLLGAGWERVDSGPAPAGVEPGLWPGLYRSQDGETIAVNAPARGVARQGGGETAPPPPVAVGRRLGGLVSAVAVGCLAVGAAVWPGWRGGGGS